MAGDRYRVVEPVRNGSRWWLVADTESKVMPNFPVAQFSADQLPGAEARATALATELNGGEEKTHGSD